MDLVSEMRDMRAHDPRNPAHASSGFLMNEYSRKVFIGGLPPDMDQDEIKEHFLPYGPVWIGHTRKAKSTATKLPCFPHKGYVFLIYEEEVSVHRLVRSCVREEGKLYVFVSSLTQINKKVQIRPWKIADSSFIMDHCQPIDPRKTIFIGGCATPP